VSVFGIYVIGGGARAAAGGTGDQMLNRAHQTLLRTGSMPRLVL
jgi:hypothetical protein